LVHLVWSGGIIFADADIFYTNNSGGSWQTPVNVTGTGLLYEFAPTMVIDSSNRIHIAYATADQLMGGVISLLYTSFHSSSGWSAPANLTSSLSGITIIDAKKSIDVNPQGTVFVAFSARIGSPRPEVYLVNNTGATWGNPVNVSQNMATDDFDDVEPSMDIDTAGNIHLVWETIGGSNYGVVYKSYSQGAWSSNQFLNATSYELDGLSIISDIHNSVHIVFCQLNESPGYDELYYTSNFGGTFSTPYNISKSDDVAENYPHIVIDNLGYAHITYLNRTGVWNQVYISSLEPVITVPADYTLIIVVGVVVAVIVVLGAAFYLLRIRKPK
jgi:hypothetical protein